MRERNSMIDPADIETSADVLSLLSICALAARQIAEGNDDPRNLGADLFRCIKIAEAMAYQTNQAMGVGA